jgi:hypothetical protein
MNVADAELRELVEDTIDPDAAEPLGVYVFGPKEPGAELGRNVERSVLLEAFGDTPELLAKEYELYEPASIFFCVLDHRRRVPAGAVRMIVPIMDGPGLKTLNDIEPIWGDTPASLLERNGFEIKLEATWDIATLAVAPEYRAAAASGLVGLGLYQSGIRSARRCGVDWMVAILDEGVHRMAKSRFHSPFYSLAAPKPYLGSAASLPACLHISEWRSRLLVSNPFLEALMFRGSGIEAALRPLDVEVTADLLASMAW